MKCSISPKREKLSDVLQLLLCISFVHCIVGHIVLIVQTDFLVSSLICCFVQMQQSLFVIHMWCETETQLMFHWDIVRGTNRNVSNLLFYSTDE